MKNFQFLTSNRFWAIVLFSLAIALKDAGVISVELAQFVMTVTAGHIGVKTVDRFAEKLGKSK
jgi:hypothetical protein